MCSVPIEVPAAERARWLAELAEALNAAHAMLMDHPHIRDHEAIAKDLHLRIAAARMEVHTLRLSRSVNPREELGPEWGESGHWPPQRGASVYKPSDKSPPPANGSR